MGPIDGHTEIKRTQSTDVVITDSIDTKLLVVMDKPVLVVIVIDGFRIDVMNLNIFYESKETVTYRGDFQAMSVYEHYLVVYGKKNFMLIDTVRSDTRTFLYPVEDNMEDDDDVEAPLYIPDDSPIVYTRENKAFLIKDVINEESKYNYSVFTIGDDDEFDEFDSVLYAKFDNGILRMAYRVYDDVDVRLVGLKTFKLCDGASLNMMYPREHWCVKEFELPE